MRIFALASWVYAFHRLSPFWQNQQQGTDKFILGLPSLGKLDSQAQSQTVQVIILKNKNQSLKGTLWDSNLYREWLNMDSIWTSRALA